MRVISFFAGLILSVGSHAAVVSAPNVEVNFDGIDPAQAQAIADTLSAARSVYTDDFGADMPEKIICKVTCGPGTPTRLYTDGHDRVFLSIPSKSKLDQPQKSGTFTLYGLCHELGHMAMYRTLKKRDWMTTAGAEGWAHFTGSTVVDRVYELKGEALWADKYDYRQDGMARLERALKSASPSEIDRGAGQWRELDKIVGRAALRHVFERWQAATIDPANPGEALAAALLSKTPEKQQALEAWWKSAAPLLVEARQASEVKAQTIDRAKLTGQPLKIAPDDNTPDAKKSIAGSGHIRRASTPGDGEWYLVAISVYGSRYGAARAPDTAFEISLCDMDNRPIGSWDMKYSAFVRGEPKWTRFELPPTRVPKEFCIALNFRPTASNGVFVHIDSSTSGGSSTGLPGKEPQPLEQGDWMIRVELDQPKSADALNARQAK
jgi:hypothetical protein